MLLWAEFKIVQKKWLRQKSDAHRICLGSTSRPCVSCRSWYPPDTSHCCNNFPEIDIYCIYGAGKICDAVESPTICVMNYRVLLGVKFSFYKDSRAERHDWVLMTMQIMYGSYCYLALFWTYLGDASCEGKRTEKIKNPFQRPWYFFKQRQKAQESKDDVKDESHKSSNFWLLYQWAEHEKEVNLQQRKPVISRMHFCWWLRKKKCRKQH